MLIDERIEVEIRWHVVTVGIGQHRFLLLANRNGFIVFGEVQREAHAVELILYLLPFGFVDERDNGLIELGEAHEDVCFTEHTERPNHGTDNRKIAERIVKILGIFAPIRCGSPG